MGRIRSRGLERAPSTVATMGISPINRSPRRQPRIAPVPAHRVGLMRQMPCKPRGIGASNGWQRDLRGAHPRSRARSLCAAEALLSWVLRPPTPGQSLPSPLPDNSCPVPIAQNQSNRRERPPLPIRVGGASFPTRVQMAQPDPVTMPRRTTRTQSPGALNGERCRWARSGRGTTFGAVPRHAKRSHMAATLASKRSDAQQAQDRHRRGRSKRRTDPLSRWLYRREM